jgi:hypothetical protein
VAAAPRNDAQLQASEGGAVSVQVVIDVMEMLKVPRETMPPV